MVVMMTSWPAASSRSFLRTLLPMPCRLHAHFSLRLCDKTSISLLQRNNRVLLCQLMSILKELCIWLAGSGKWRLISLARLGRIYTKLT